VHGENAASEQATWGPGQYEGSAADNHGIAEAARPLMITMRPGDIASRVEWLENLIGNGTLRGTVYSRWDHVILAGKETYNARFVAGTMRVVALLDVEISPDSLLPPAQDIFLVE
jgi:hypothetical protein